MPDPIYSRDYVRSAQITSLRYGDSAFNYLIYPNSNRQIP
jgi:hypothetical protein